MTFVPDGDSTEDDSLSAEIEIVENELVEIELVEPLPGGHPLIAWTVILALVLLILVLARGEPEAVDADGGDPIGQAVMEMQGKYLVGASEMPGAEAGQFYEQAQPLNAGPIANRLRFVVLAGELAGASEAAEQLASLSEKLERREVEPTAEQSRLMDALSRLYSDYREQRWDASSLDASERELLKRDLGWFGELALAPAEGADSEARSSVLSPARRTTIVFVLAFVAGVIAALAGVAALIAFILQLLNGKIRSRLTARFSGGAIYAETFAVWMLLFVGLSFALAIIPGVQPSLLLNVPIFFLSLSALAWPVLRGISWKQVREDVGLTIGPRPYAEPLWGIVCYVATLPVVVVGLLAIMVMMQLQGLGGETGGDEFHAGAMPTHPIVQWIGETGWWGRLVVFGIACIAAPVVEETMFRGVLYRHLRNSTAAWRVGLSILFSVLLNSFLFAVIHPQGFLAVPVLMSLAAGFSLAREWRGSLWAPMTAHAVNNALAITAMFLIL